MSTPPRIGVFGGTFDPPHVGHLVAARNVAHALGLDSVLFMVASVPWQKAGTRSISPAVDRLAMVELAVDGHAGLRACALEIARGGDSVTADTISDLRERCPDHEFVVIVGSDAAAGMGTWRRAGELAEMSTVAVIDRPGALGGRPPKPFVHRVVGCPLVDLSSSDLRDRVRESKPIDFLVPDGVRDYIDSHGLYQ